VNGATIQELNAHLNADETLRGVSTLPALKLLGSPPVVAAFREADEDPYQPDDEVLDVVERALLLRLAVAERWERAGVSELERRAAEASDRVLEPHQGALTALENAEYLVRDYDLDAFVDYDAWWGFLASPSYEQACGFVDEAIVELRAKRQSPPPEPPAWEKAADAWWEGWWENPMEVQENEDWDLLDWACKLRETKQPSSQCTECGFATASSREVLAPTVCGYCCDCTGGTCRRCGAFDENPVCPTLSWSSARRIVRHADHVAWCQSWQIVTPQT
jgi:hypothetical protein